VRIFGYEITRAEEQKTNERPTFSEPIKQDGAVNIAAGSTIGSYVDLEGTIKTEAELVSRYRQMMIQPEIEKAINEIVNEAVVKQEGQPTLELILQDSGFSKDVKKKIIEEFEYILDLLNFEDEGYDMFKRWFVDGRSYHQAIIDRKNPNEGIHELRYIDPRKIRKIREVARKKDPITQVIMTLTKSEYYLYNEKGFNTGGAKTDYSNHGIKIAKDSIIHSVSGLMDQNNTMCLSYLHPAIKPLNQLRALEDATLIYHLSRAPERRVFKVDVGNLPKARAEQHVNDMMTKYKNRISYNSTTGETADQRQFMHMNEDFWLPTREGGRGTEIDVLGAGTALPDLIQSVEYFQDRLYRALSVPLTRMKPDAVYNLGRATEITRDEVNFSKFIDRLRNKFISLIVNSLERQLILKNITTPEDWEANIKKNIKFKWARDNHFTELKDQEIMNERLLRVRDAEDYAGKYFSHEWLRRTILRQTDDEMKEQDKLIKSEQDNLQYMPPEEDQNDSEPPQIPDPIIDPPEK